VWALGLAAAVTKTTNPLLVGLVMAVLALVVVNRRVEAPWARALKYYLALALTIIVMRVVSRSIFGGDVTADRAHRLFTLPGLSLPSWAAGVQVGGPVTLEATLSSLYGGLQLGCLLCCVGAANVLANPKRALRSLPGALYELGAAMVVAFNIAPQIVESVHRVRRSRKLRGDARTRLHAVRTIAIPVLQDALDRSIGLASSMDSRGYGRTSSASPRSRRLVAVLMLAGLLSLCIGVYGLAVPGVLGVVVPLALTSGLLLCATGLWLGSRRVGHTEYRPDRWLGSEWVVVAAGLMPFVFLSLDLGSRSGSLNPSFSPATWPGLPIADAVAILVAALPAFVAPPPLKRPVSVPVTTQPALESRSGEAHLPHLDRLEVGA
jgi:energy-coupling factor transport system permease protein